MPRAAAVVAATARAVRLQPAHGDRATWLPQPADWAALTVEAQEADPGSMLDLYRAALRLRRELPELGDGPLEWLDDACRTPDVLAFRRGDGFACVVNTGDDARAAARRHDRPALERTARGAAPLPGDSTAWLRIDRPDRRCRGIRSTTPPPPEDSARG